MQKLPPLSLGCVAVCGAECVGGVWCGVWCGVRCGGAGGAGYCAAERSAVPGPALPPPRSHCCCTAAHSSTCRHRLALHCAAHTTTTSTTSTSTTSSILLGSMFSWKASHWADFSWPVCSQFIQLAQHQDARHAALPRARPASRHRCSARHCCPSV